MGALPTEYVVRAGPRPRDRLPRRPRARPRGGRRASAALVLGSADADLRAQLGEVFDRAGLVCERTDDVIGVEMAGAAKNAAALAAAAAEPHGLNAAGIAAAEVWRECVELRARRAARELETFSGLAGVGDLTATVLAPQQPQPPRRRAARRRRPGGADPRPDRPGLGGRSTRCR